MSAARSALPTGAEKEAVVAAMFDRIAPGYDRMNRIISLGLDRKWRRSTIAGLALAPGATVLDLACGTGDLCRELATQGYRPIGVDFSAGMLANARTDAPLLRADATRLPIADASVEGIVCGFALRNFVALEPLFAECARVLRPGGRIAMLDTAVPDHMVMRAGHHLWFRCAVPMLGRVIARDAAAYAYLPASTAYLPPTTALLNVVCDAGFASVQRRTMTSSAVQLLTGTRA